MKKNRGRLSTSVIPNASEGLELLRVGHAYGKQ